MLQLAPNTAPNVDGVLVIDETDDVETGTDVAQAGQPYLGSDVKVCVFAEKMVFSNDLLNNYAATTVWAAR